MTLENLDTVMAFIVVILLLSLVITTLVQMTSWLFRFRESTLLWGIKRIPSELSEDLVSKLARSVVNHESLKPKSGRSANAISFDELVKVLQVVVEASPKEAGMDKVMQALRQAPIQEVTALSTAIVADLSAALPQQAGVVAEAVERVKKKTLEAGTKLRFWFDTIMTRTTERFTSHTRWVTIGAAILVSFAARIDSLDILRQLSQKPDVRARLVQISDPLLKQAAGILEPPTTAASSPAADSRAKPATAERKPPPGEPAVAKEAPLPQALKRVKLLHPEMPSDFSGPDSEDLEAWKKAIAARIPAELEESVLADFTSEYSKQELDRLLGQFRALHGTLSQASLEIRSFCWKDYPKHFPGVLLSVLLLSLGAPFWFNMLRQLSNLRPFFARKIDEDATKGANA